MGRARRPLSVLLALLCLATVASAQRRRRQRAPQQAPEIHNIPYDGQFIVAGLEVHDRARVGSTTSACRRGRTATRAPRTTSRASSTRSPR